MSSYRDQKWHANQTGHGGIKKFDMLLNVKSTTLRVSMTWLRGGCHSLEIERGRYHKPHSILVFQRLCERCKMTLISCVCV